MSQDDVKRTPPWMKQDTTPGLSDEAPAPEGGSTAPPPEHPESPALGDTVGTGTSIAIGCIAGTILLILIGLIFVGIAALF